MTKIPGLSIKARELLLAAAKGAGGLLTVRHDLAPLQIGVGSQVLVTVESVGKEYYEWTAALEELVTAGMLDAPKDREGEEYYLTPVGKEAAGRI